MMKSTLRTVMALLTIVLLGAVSAFAQTTPNPEDIVLTLPTINLHLAIGLVCAVVGFAVGFVIGRGNRVRKILPMLLFALLLGGQASPANAQGLAPFVAPAATADTKPAAPPAGTDTKPATGEVKPETTQAPPPATPALATKADIDALGVKIDAIQAPLGYSGGTLFVWVLFGIVVAWFVSKAYYSPAVPATPTNLNARPDPPAAPRSALRDEVARVESAPDADAQLRRSLDEIDSRLEGRPFRPGGPTGIVPALFLVLGFAALANAQSITAAYPNVVVKDAGPASVRIVGTKLADATSLEIVQLDAAGKATPLRGFVYSNFKVVNAGRVTVNITADSSAPTGPRSFRLLKADGTELVKSSGTRSIRVFNFDAADARAEANAANAANKAAVAALTRRVDNVPNLIEGRVRGVDEGINQRFADERQTREELEAKVVALTTQVSELTTKLGEVGANEQALAESNGTTQDALRHMGYVIVNSIAPTVTIKNPVTGKKEKVPDPSVAAAVAQALHDMKALTTAITIK